MPSAETFLVHARIDARETVAAPLIRRTQAISFSVNHDLAELEPEWRAFERTADCSVFQTFDWLDCWQRNIGARNGTQPAIVCGRDATGRPLFILPLAVQPTRLARQLRFLGGSMCDYNAPLLAPDFPQTAGEFAPIWREIRERLANDARTRHDLIVLDKMPERIGAQANPLLALPTALNPSAAYAMRLGDEWERFYTEKRSSATRRRDRTKRKRIGEAGEVRLVTATSTPERIATLDILIRQKSRAFARMGVPDIFTPPGHREFYHDAATRGGFEAHVSRLTVGETSAATNLGLVFRGRYYHVLASYDGGPLSRFGPGVIHLHELMKYAIAQGCDLFDFTIGDEPYKREWSDEFIALRDHMAAESARGVVIAAIVGALRRAKRTIKQSALLWSLTTRARTTLARLSGRKPKATSAPISEDV